MYFMIGRKSLETDGNMERTWEIKAAKVKRLRFSEEVSFRFQTCFVFFSFFGFASVAEDPCEVEAEAPEEEELPLAPEEVLLPDEDEKLLPEAEGPEPDDAPAAELPELPALPEPLRQEHLCPGASSRPQ